MAKKAPQNNYPQVYVTGVPLPFCYGRMHEVEVPEWSVGTLPEMTLDGHTDDVLAEISSMTVCGTPAETWKIESASTTLLYHYTVLALRFTVKTFFGSVYESWAKNYINKHLWRCAPLYTFEDMTSEATFMFYDCVRRYQFVRDSKQFMKLFQIAFVNQVNDVANKRNPLTSYTPDKNGVLPRVQETTFSCLSSDAEEGGSFEGRLCDNSPLSALGTALVDLIDAVETAPVNVYNLLKALAPEFLSSKKSTGDRLTTRDRKTAAVTKPPRRRPAESHNDYFCRVLGLDPTVTNVQDEVQSWITNSLSIENHVHAH